MGSGSKSVRRSLVGLIVSLACLLGACGSSTSTVNQATARAEISQQYSTLFNFANKNISVKVPAIQDGSSLKQALSQALSSPLVKEVSGARVESVQLLGSSACSKQGLPSPCAKVTFELLGTNGQPLFSTPSSGYAVYVSGKWLAAKSTACGLLELFYSVSGRTGVPPGC